MKKLMLLAFPLLILNACTDHDPVLETATPETANTKFTTHSVTNNARLGEEVSLQVKETVVYRPTHTSVTFLRIVEDSRCPEGVDCIWQGRAVAVFAVEERENYQEVHLSTEDSQEGPSTTTTVFGKTLELTKINPYPVNNMPAIPADAYVASIILHAGIIDTGGTK